MLPSLILNKRKKIYVIINYTSVSVTCLTKAPYSKVNQQYIFYYGAINNSKLTINISKSVVTSVTLTLCAKVSFEIGKFLSWSSRNHLVSTTVSLFSCDIMINHIQAAISRSDSMSSI